MVLTIKQPFFFLNYQLFSMNKKQAKKLFDKYVKNKCSAQEIEMLNKYLESFQDKGKLWSELRYDEEIKDKIWLKIKSEVGNDENRFSIKRYLKYAAIFIGLIGGLLWYQLANDAIVPEDNLITDSEVILKSSDNTLTKIDSNSEQSLFDKAGKVIGSQKGNQISYDTNKEIKELFYNEILVPNGKRFQLILSDGTLVHMNSGSSLKYPVNFISGQKRQVFLNGEAYFEVTKDSQARFLVTTEDIEIEVLGTHFNVSSYKGAEAFTILAEGRVAVYNQKNGIEFGNPTVIRPGEKASIAQDRIDVNKVDINNYLGWMEGRLTFNNESFINIVQKIERHYGVVIENNYNALSPVKFRGAFKENEKIIDLMDTFKESAGFEYEIQDNKIKIKSMEE